MKVYRDLFWAVLCLAGMLCFYVLGRHGEAFAYARETGWTLLTFFAGSCFLIAVVVLVRFFTAFCDWMLFPPAALKKYRWETVQDDTPREHCERPCPPPPSPPPPKKVSIDTIRNPPVPPHRILDSNVLWDLVAQGKTITEDHYLVEAGTMVLWSNGDPYIVDPRDSGILIGRYLHLGTLVSDVKEA